MAAGPSARPMRPSSSPGHFTKSRSISPCCGDDRIEMTMGEAGRELDGRVAIVTGSGRNIGRAIAPALAAGGAAVVVNARSNHGEAEEVARAIESGGGQ